MSGELSGDDSISGRFDALCWLPTSTFIIAVISGAIFALLPHLDVTISELFYRSGQGFVGKQVAAIGFLRMVFKGFYVSCCLLAISGLIITRGRVRAWLGLVFRNWLYLAICLALGPGVVANLVLKDHWGRARPNQIIEFGGTKSFTAALTPTDQCDRNCSFVSGEASSTFAVFFAGAFLFRRRAAALLMTGVAAGAVTGLVRMAQGAHFLSDVIFAGLLMALTVAAVNFVFEVVAEGSRSPGATALTEAEA